MRCIRRFTINSIRKAYQRRPWASIPGVTSFASPIKPRAKLTLGFWTALAALISLSLVCFLGKSYENLLRGIDSNIHAKASMDVTSHGFLPLLPIPDGGKSGYFNDHPFFYFWLNGGIMRLLGPSAWSARLLTGVFSTGCVVMTLLLGMQFHSAVFGVIAALFFLFSRDVILTGATVSLDPAMLFFILLSFWYWGKSNWVKMGLAAGIGLWIKTPVVLLVYPTAFLAGLFFGPRKSLHRVVYSCLLAVAIGSVVWVVTGAIAGWEWVADYWMRQFWGTAVRGRNIHSTDPWMFFRLIRNGFIPGLPFLLFSVIKAFLNRKIILESRYRLFCISLIAAFVLFACITPLRFRMDYYYNPVFPFLAFLAAYSVVDLVEPIGERFYAGLTTVVTFLLAFLLVTPIRLGPEAFVALKRFIPLIQSSGTCVDDEVWWIDGGEPIGSAFDSKLVLHFYTGRRVRILSCSEWATAMELGRPAWVISSIDNYTHCLNSQQKDLFHTQIRMDHQVLLGTESIKMPDSNTMVDLSPLEMELKAVTDCLAPKYPVDIYHRRTTD